MKIFKILNHLIPIIKHVYIDFLSINIIGDGWTWTDGQDFLSANAYLLFDQYTNDSIHSCKTNHLIILSRHLYHFLQKSTSNLVG